jgi:hypothetical protein
MSLLGTVSIGGTMTIEDFTNIDSVGLITARNGIDVTGGTVTITTGANSASPAGSGDNLVIKDSDGCGLSILSGNGNSQNIYLGSVSDNDAVRLEGFYNSGSPYFNIYTAGSERLRITSDGKIGIGDATPENTLTIKNIGSFEGDANSFYLGSNFTGTGQNFTGTGKHAQRFFFNNASSNGYLKYENTGATGNAGDTITWQERFRITSAGKFGIGTNNPQEQLVVSNSGAEGFEVTAGVASNVNKIVNYNRSSSVYTSLRIDAAEHIFRIGASEKLRIASNGYVGMNLDANVSSNATVTPWTNLHVVGSNVADGVAARNNATPTGQLHVSSSGYGINQGGTISLGSEADNVNPNATYASISGRRVSSLGYQYGGYLTLNVSDGTTLDEKVRITSGGDVVIGTTAAARGPLHIHKNSADCYLHVTNSTTGTGSGDGFTIHQSGVETLLNNRESGNMRLYTNGGEKVRITSGGKVLINSTANSDAQLLVKGADKLHPVLKFDGLSANGFSLLGDEYQTDESHFTMGIAYSSASLVTGWGVKVSPTASNEYLSSQDTYSTKHSAVRHDGDGWKFLSNSSSQTVTTDSVVSLTERLRITSGGDLLLGGHSAYTYDDTGATNVILDIYGGATAGKRGILSLSGRTGNDNGDIGTIWFNNDNNSGSGPGNTMKLSAVIQAKITTSDGNSGSDAGAYMQFMTKPEGGSVSERLRITDAGYVGINRTSPTQRFHMSGAIRQDGSGNNVQYHQACFAFGSGATHTIYTLSGNGNDATAIAVFEYVCLYAYAGINHEAGIIYASTRRTNSNTAWNDLDNIAASQAGNDSSIRPTLFWDNGVLKITVGSSVQCTGTLRLTTRRFTVTRNYSAG